MSWNYNIQDWKRLRDEQRKWQTITSLYFFAIIVGLISLYWII